MTNQPTSMQRTNCHKPRL